MNYTDEEILDLESSLDGIGHSKQVVLILVEPDGWDRQGKGSFGKFLGEIHGRDLYDQGLCTAVSHMLIPGPDGFVKKSRSAIKIMGPSIRAGKALEELYEKYNCSMALDFTE
jgi:hypothetical protein